MDFGTHESLEPINALQILRDNCTDRLFSVYPFVPFELWTMIAYRLLQNKWMNEYNKKEGMVGKRWESSNLNSWLSPNLLGPQFISLHQLFSSSPPSPSLQDLGGLFQALSLQPAFLDFAPGTWQVPPSYSYQDQVTGQQGIRPPSNALASTWCLAGEESHPWKVHSSQEKFCKWRNTPCSSCKKPKQSKTMQRKQGQHLRLIWMLLLWAYAFWNNLSMCFSLLEPLSDLRIPAHSVGLLLVCWEAFKLVRNSKFLVLGGFFSSLF